MVSGGITAIPATIRNQIQDGILEQESKPITWSNEEIYQTLRPDVARETQHQFLFLREERETERENYNIIIKIFKTAG